MRMFVYVGLVIAQTSGIEALTVVETLQPIRATGEEVGLIFIPGSFMEKDQYRKTALAIQSASELRLWAALTGKYYNSLANEKQLRLVVDQAVEALEEAGMVSKNFVGVGHGSGGYFLQKYAEKPGQLQALVLLGAALSRDTALEDYPCPVLTIGAELDGITRITRLAHEYDKLKESLKTSSSVLQTNPIVVIDGANHRQFASGKFHRKVENEDLAPELTEDETHRAIGNHVSNFLTATFVASREEKDQAVTELEAAFRHTNMTLQPFLDMRDLVQKAGHSRWTVLAQERLAEEFASQVQVLNKVANSTVEFYTDDPSISIDGDFIQVGTSTFLVNGPHGEYYKIPNTESPIEMDMKLNAKVAISAAVAARDNSTGMNLPASSLVSAPLTCRALNELALQVALSQSSPIAQQRYKDRGRPFVFEDDTVREFYPFWVAQGLKRWEDAGGHHVRAVARVALKKGEHYCKVISPYFAMEWIHVDSLRKL